MENKDWLIILINEVDSSIEAVTICKDGYVFDYRKKKLFVLKKNTIGLLKKLVDEYDKTDLISNLDSKCLIKCNGDTKFVSNNQDFYNKVIKLVFNASNIKHPPELLDEVIALIGSLRTSGELDSMIQADGVDVAIDRLISMC